jgi:hypothetical protein
MPRAFPSANLGLVLTLASTLASACGDAQGGAGTGDSTGDSTDTDGGSGTTGGPVSASGTTSGAMTDSGSSDGETTDRQTNGGPADESSGDATTEDPGAGSTGDDGTTGAVEACEAPVMPIPCDHDNPDVFNALGLGCSDDPGKAIPIEDAVVKAPDESSYRTAKSFGTAVDPDDPTVPAWAAQEGERFLVIGTGIFPKIDKKDGSLTENDDEDSHGNMNPDDVVVLPGVVKHQYGSNDGEGGTPFVDCDGLHDCSDTIQPQWDLDPKNVANDVFYMELELTAPAGTHGFAIDFVFFSEEWPVYVNTTYNDMLVVWSTSESYTGNITYIDDEPATATGLAPFMKHQPGDDLLAGTGFPGDDEGAATGWMTARGSVQPGEKFKVAITMFDMGDALWDSVAILDNFRWECEGCDPVAVGGCGITPKE